MKNTKFKKIASVLSGLALVGGSMGLAVAGAQSYPSSFANSNGVAIVYGANADASDYSAVNSINTNMLSIFSKNQSVGTGSETLTENEVVLGTSLVGNGKLVANITDNKLASLMDGKLDWDDGNISKSSFNVHEEINFGDMELLTSLDDSDLNETALTNNKGLEYKYVFEDSLDVSRIGHEDADKLEITILGKEYEVKGFDGDSITISTSEEKSLQKGDKVSYNGTELVVQEIYDNEVNINGVFITEGKTKKVNGVEVYVERVLTHKAETIPSTVIIKYGTDISKTYTDGESYIGQDESEPNWVWSINNPGEAGGYIGVRYNQRELDADDNLVYAGNSYVFPENFATVRFDKLTDVDYQNYEVSFEDSLDLYEANNNNVRMYEDAKVLVLEGKEADAFVVNGVETDKVYLTINANNVTEVFFNDVNKDFGTSAKPRYAFFLSGLEMDIGTLQFEDSDFDISFNNVTRKLNLTNPSGVISIKVNPTGDLTYLGTDDEQAENNEVIIEGKAIGNREDDVMSHYGIVFKDLEANGDGDRVLFQVPSEQVYGQITLSAGTFETEVKTIDVVIVKDTEIDSVKNRDLIIVGGSCINSVAASLLGGAYCGSDFTQATGIGTGQYLVKQYVSPYNANKVAYLVAGYNAEDTTSAMQSIVLN